jgi:hypothetical protein
MATNLKPRYGRLDKEKPRGSQRVYTYICSDGVARTRCYQHAMLAKGSRYGIPAFVSEYDVPKHMGKAHTGSCTECTWNQAAGVVSSSDEPRAEIE